MPRTFQMPILCLYVCMYVCMYVLCVRVKKYSVILFNYYLSQCMRFPTIWYVRPAKPQTSLRIRAV